MQLVSKIMTNASFCIIARLNLWSDVQSTRLSLGSSEPHGEQAEKFPASHLVARPQGDDTHQLERDGVSTGAP